MLFCCNTLFEGSLSKVIKNNSLFYQRIEFGMCPVCGVAKFREIKFSVTTQKEKYKVLSGLNAEKKIKELLDPKNNGRCGTKTNQNFYFGDFKKTNNKDENGLPIYLQLRKNLNGQYEVLGTVKTILTNVSG